MTPGSPRFSMEEDDRARPRAPAGGRCAEHPDREAEAVCAECGRALCADCVRMRGGGHAFCAACMELSRLVDAEPGRLGEVVEVREAVRPRAALLLLLAAFALLGALVAALVLWGRWSGG